MRGRVRLLFGISIFWLALSMVFDGLTTLVLPHHLLGLTDEASKATTLGLLTFSGLLAGMLVQPLAGTFSDRLRLRWGRRGMLGLGALLILASLAAFSASRNLAAVFLAYVMLQVAASVAQAAQQGFIPDLVAPPCRAPAAGLKGFMDLGGALLGFVVLGQLLGSGQTGWALLAIAVAVSVTFVLTMVLVHEPPCEAPEPVVAGPVRTTLLDSFRLDLRRHRAFAWLVVSRFLFLLGTYAIGRFFLYFVADRLGLDAGRAAEEAGTLLAGLTLLTALGAPLAGWAADRFGRIPLMVAGAVLSAVGALVLSIAGSPVEIFLFGGLLAAGSAAFAGANWALAADLAPPAQAARLLGLANFGTAGAAAAAGLFGPLVDWPNSIAPSTGYTVLFVAAGLSFVASGLALRRIAAPGRRPAVSYV